MTLLTKKSHFSLFDLNALIGVRKDSIEEWILAKKGKRSWPIYHSLDLRISQDKICHVDSNLFPSGFHHLSECGRKAAEAEFSALFATKQYSNILILAEHFTRNIAYSENLQALAAILKGAINADVRFGTMESESDAEAQVILCPVQREQDALFVMLEGRKWYPDFILSNNDFTVAIPELLKQLKQPLLPMIQKGWFQRRKSKHFAAYNIIACELADFLEIDPFYITTKIAKVENVDFRNQEGLVTLKEATEALMQEIVDGYKSRDITEKPYVFLKSDRGTFGMGIMVVREPESILSTNKKARHSLNKIKSGVLNSEILIQEGISTMQTVEDAAAESMLYSVNGKLVGEIIRYNALKNNHDNLNSKGMSFASVARIDTDALHSNTKWLINSLAQLACVQEDDVASPLI